MTENERSIVSKGWGDRGDEYAEDCTLGVAPRGGASALRFFVKEVFEVGTKSTKGSGCLCRSPDVLFIKDVTAGPDQWPDLERVSREVVEWSTDLIKCH